MTERSDAERLAAAANKIEAGWCQGHSWTHGWAISEGELVPRRVITERCLTGALREVAKKPALSRLFGAVGKELGVPMIASVADQISWLAVWNDQPRRTKEEVATALRNAKRWLDGEGDPT